MRSWLVFVSVLFVAILFAGAFFDATPLENEQVLSSETQGGEENIARFLFDRSQNEEEQMAAFGFSDKKQILSLATDSPEVTFSQPLDEDEVSLLFYLLVVFLEPDVPIEGRLVSVCFASDKDCLTVCAEADVDFSRIVKAFKLYFLPEYARFSVSIPFCIKNSEISAYYEGISLRCEQVDMPEVLLSYGCAAAFGERDYKRFFGNAVGNVLKNACFYG